MKYICPECNYIYDESLGDKYENIKPGTKFEDLGVEFVCPVCSEIGENFQEIIEEVNYIDEENLIGLDFEHYIEIKNLEDSKIEVSVGKGSLHPSGEEHRISQISLYDEYGDLVYEYFLGIGEDPIVEFDVDGFDEYEIRVRCTIHGLWGRKVKV